MKEPFYSPYYIKPILSILVYIGPDMTNFIKGSEYSTIEISQNDFRVFDIDNIARFVDRKYFITKEQWRESQIDKLI